MGSLAELGGAAIVGGAVGTYRALAPPQTGNFSGVDIIQFSGLALISIVADLLDKPEGESTFFGGVATGGVANLGAMMGALIAGQLQKP